MSALVWKIIAAAGKMGLEIGAQAAQFGDIKHTLEARETALNQRIAAEEFIGQQVAAAAIADLASSTGAVNAAAAVSGVSGESVTSLQQSEGAVFAIEESNRLLVQSARVRALRTERSDIPRQKARARTNFALGVTGALFDAGGSVGSGMANAGGQGGGS